MKSTKTFLALALLVATTTSCSSSGGSTSQAAPVPAQAAPEVLKTKPMPELGDSQTQYDFQLADLKAIAQGQPRPVQPETLAVLAGNPPQGVDVCNLPFSALTQKMYLSCFPEGITYVGASNIAGWAGEEVSRSGDAVVYTWRGNRGSFLMATFKNGRLTAKSQQGLK
jgi:hypothetical protein